MISALTLWVPGLLDKRRLQEARSELQNLKLPALETLIAKADRLPAHNKDFYQQACYLFHQPNILPIAATTAKVEVPEYNIHDFWVRVDPVQLIPDRDSLVLIPGAELAISEQESKALLEAFNDHFKQDGVELIWGSNTHWYLAIKQPVDIQTTAIDLVSHKPVNEFYPQGNAAQYWRQLMNEAQMLFYSHPVNEQRRDKGWPEINSVWPWAEGKVEFNGIKTREDALICSTDPYLQGVAQLTKSSQSASPKNLADFMSIQKRQDSSHSLVFLDDVHTKLDDLSLSEWLDLLTQLEQDWFAPLLEKLNAGEIESLLIDLGCEYYCHLKPSHMNRFWRFKKAIYKI